ncbi:2-phosphosulfolactate phosphatase [Actinoplanes sp. Pm04-4]|uniref:Probable 2-phosphosulfolactate phosphatase n=1 Tax=Paractinoplanes pyxinae TaxID=2997416 RepID=A0ABT4B9E5_9ACTN|nr:2-phosphosulfolactate phosphatase [Actinoplanes pyxinae]MCY1143086.1 2-phosphosulfolactate phosphatase [Actinoplanes pyxinae]
MSIVGMDAEVPPGRAVVVIDVIRAFTTAAIAFARGATDIACAASAGLGRELRRRHPDRLLAGEVGGLKPPDFDLGNSPFEMSAALVDGRRLIQATSNGTRGLARCPEPVALLAASAVNAGATADWITTHHPGRPWTLLCTGRSAEDWACARYLAGLLGGPPSSRADLIAGIRQGAADRPDLTLDLPFCEDVDRFPFAMVGAVREDHVLLTRASRRSDVDKSRT